MTFAPAQAANERYLRIASGDVTSGLFDLAGVVASAVTNPADARACRQDQNCGDVGLIAVAQTSASADAALAKLRAGTADAAVVPDSIAYAAYNGTGARRSPPWPELRALANLAVRPMIILVRGDIATTSLAALRGKRIATGPRGSDASDSVVALLGAMGLKATDYTSTNSDLDESAYTLISQKRADAVIVLADALAAPEREALARGDIKLLSPSKPEFERVSGAYPFAERRVFDPGTGQNYATICSGSVLVTRADMQQNVVATMLSRMWLRTNTDLDRIARGAGADLDPGQAAKNLPTPLHTSAASFYQEHHLMESDHATP